jgi:NAD(P)H-flavin reductase
MDQARVAGYEVITRQDFSDVTFLLEVLHPQLARAARPGKFDIVMSSEHGERIPLTIADYDRERGTVTLVIQAVGKTTREMQRECRVGTRLVALVGPMGVPSHIGKARKVLCVGGGLGVAPVYPQARGYKESGAYVIGILGFRNRDLMFWKKMFAPRATNSSSAPMTVPPASRAWSPKASGLRYLGIETSTSASPSARR